MCDFQNEATKPKKSSQKSLGRAPCPPPPHVRRLHAGQTHCARAHAPRFFTGMTREKRVRLQEIRNYTTHPKNKMNELFKGINDAWRAHAAAAQAPFAPPRVRFRVSLENDPHNFPRVRRVIRARVLWRPTSRTVSKLTRRNACASVPYFVQCFGDASALRAASVTSQGSLHNTETRSREVERVCACAR